MKRQVPRLTTDEAAEAFLEQDLSDLDFVQFKAAQLEFERKDARLTMRVPQLMLDAVKQSAKPGRLKAATMLRSGDDPSIARRCARSLNGTARISFSAASRPFMIATIAAPAPTETSQPTGPQMTPPIAATPAAPAA